MPKNQKRKSVLSEVGRLLEKGNTSFLQVKDGSKSTLLKLPLTIVVLCVVLAPVIGVFIGLFFMARKCTVSVCSK